MKRLPGWRSSVSLNMLPKKPRVCNNYITHIKILTNVITAVTISDQASPIQIGLSVPQLILKASVLPKSIPFLDWKTWWWLTNHHLSADCLMERVSLRVSSFLLTLSQLSLVICSVLGLFLIWLLPLRACPHSQIFNPIGCQTLGWWDWYGQVGGVCSQYWDGWAGLGTV